MPPCCLHAVRLFEKRNYWHLARLWLPGFAAEHGCFMIEALIYERHEHWVAANPVCCESEGTLERKHPMELKWRASSVA